MQKDNSKAFYSIKEFAAKLDVHHNTVRNAIKNKKLIAIKLGKGKNATYRIPMSEIERLALIDLTTCFFCE